MTTLLYGSIIQIISTDTIYENKLFFVERLEDDELVLKSNDGNIIELQIEDGRLDPAIIEINLVYKPTKGYCQQNKLFPLQWVEVEFNDQTIKGQIIRADTIIEIKLKNAESESIYIPVDRGLPKDVKITRISKPIMLTKVDTEEVDSKEASPEEGEILGYINHEDETEMVQYFFSIEQQTTDLLEHLLMYIPEEDRTPILMKKMFKMIQRYKELRTKYTIFTNRILINKLPREQIYSNALKLKTKCFIPVSKDIEVNCYNDSSALFFRKFLPNWIDDIADKLNKEGKFDEKNKAFNELTENHIYHYTNHSKINNRRIKIEPNPNQTQQVYLYDSSPNLLEPFSRYDIRVDKPFLVHSIMTPPVDYLKYSKIYDLGSSILNKSNLNKIQYYGFLYKGMQYNVKDTDVDNLFVNDAYVYYENHSDLYETFLQKCSPTLKNWIEVGLDGQFINPFYNFYQSIKELETVNISEFNSGDYLIVEAFIKMAVKHFISIPKLPLIAKPEYKFIEHTITSRLSDLYKDLMPKELQTTYFSSSELFKIGEIDNFKYYKENYVKNLAILDITDEEIRGMIDEIKARSQEYVEEKISKVYKTEEEREADNKTIILKDVKGIPGLEIIFRILIERKRKLKKLDTLKYLIDTLIDNNLKATENMPPAITAEIVQLIVENKVIEGELCYVEDSKKKYAWDGKWVDIESNPTCFIKKKLYKGSCDNLEKEIEYKERISRLVNDLEQEKKRHREVTSANFDVEIQKSKGQLYSLNSKKMKYDLKYNEEKRIYAVLETQKDATGVSDSPYFSLRARILNEADLIFKYKAIQLFIQKYTKRGEDPYWYYCIETGIKLLPTFYHKLADSFLITQTYEKVIEAVCLDQGTLSDNGDKWVDKYSGYIIKDINFEDEGIAYETVIKEKDKPLFDEVVVEELEMERDITLSVKTLLFYLGVYPEENNLYSLIMKSYNASTAGIKNEIQKKEVKMYAIISHVLVYIQTHNLKLGKPFPNCKLTFEGFPLTESTNIEGIKYVVCVVSKLAKATPPWNVLAKTSNEDLTKYITIFISKFVITMIEIEELLIKRRQEPLVEKQVFQSDWPQFSPRLKQIIPVEYQERRLYSYSDYLDRIRFLSYTIQGLIHKHVADQSLILKDRQDVPYLINSCCEKDNYVYKYLLEKTRIGEPLKEIINLKHSLLRFESLLLGEKMYFIENTKIDTSEPSTELDETTIYGGLIKWVTTNPSIFQKFEFSMPKYNKNDKLSIKITKMKEQGIIVSEETFLIMLQKSAFIIPRPSPTDYEPMPEDEIVIMLENPEKINNYLDQNIREMISKMDSPLKPILMFNNTFKHNKTNLVIPPELEHLNHMNQILYNKINTLHVFSEMIKNGKSALDSVVCKHWKLSDVHEKDIQTSADSYYLSILNITHDERLKKVMEEIPLTRYMKLIQLNIKNQTTKNLLYHYIFVHILYDYNLKKANTSISKYLKLVTQIFEKEDKRALNYDTKSIEYDTKISKKSETQIKTDYFKNLSLEERKSENVLKEHRLDKWGAGLQKGMFKYVKGNYLKDKTNAQAVIDNIAHDEPDIYEEPVKVNDDEDGYDISEKAEDDDDAEYEEEE